MSLVFKERASDSPYIETITHGYTVNDGVVIRPAEMNWHMVFTKYAGDIQLIVVGPWTTAGVVTWVAGAEILWIRFKLGAFMPHLPTKHFLDSETSLPSAASHKFWLNGAAWQFPNYENADTFINKLAHQEILVQDPIITTALQDEPLAVASRTVRHRFLRATGLTQSYIRQMKRAQDAKTLLAQGVSILDVVYQLGYFDQPHLTRAMKQFIGYTPAQQLIRFCQPE